MRAALGGIPIVTPEWITRSLEKKEVQLPNGDLCIRTLPFKVECWISEEHCSSLQQIRKANARFGVAGYAAQLKLDQSSRSPSYKPPLQGVHVCLSGSWKKGGNAPRKADAQTILNESGAQSEYRLLL